MGFLCKLGLHKWGNKEINFHFESNVKEYGQTCMRCGRTKTWNERV